MPVQVQAEKERQQYEQLADSATRAREAAKAKLGRLQLRKAREVQYVRLYDLVYTLGHTYLLMAFCITWCPTLRSLVSSSDRGPHCDSHSAIT